MARLLYFTRDYNTHDHRFLSALVTTGHQVYDLRLESRPRPLENRPLPGGVTRLHWAGGQGPARLRDGPRLLLDFRRVLHDIRPDVVMAGPLQRSALLTALSGFRPLISMSWGYDLIHDAGRSPIWRRATRFTLRRSRLMLGDSEIIRRLAVAHGLPPERAFIFPWGIDLELFTPGSNPPGSSPTFTLLSTRSWEPIYGIDIIARAFVQAARQVADLRLVMLGQGSQAGLLQRIFQTSGVMDRVLMPGLVRETDLPRYHRMADLYVSASHSDGTSISLLEALACGRPALVSDIPGNTEWVEPGVNGWLFADGNPGELADRILAAWSQKEQLERMGRAAHETAKQRADWQANYPRLLQAIEEIINSTTDNSHNA